jgi:hypothetical protein
VSFARSQERRYKYGSISTSTPSHNGLAGYVSDCNDGFTISIEFLVSLTGSRDPGMANADSSSWPTEEAT